MVVRSTGYTESYTRIQLSDIKGIFLTATERRKWWTLVWAIVAGWSGILFVVSLSERKTPIVSTAFLALGLGVLVWNYLLGAGCRAHVVTGVQTAELPSLVRIKKTRRVLARLEPLIAAAQADLVIAPPPAAVEPQPAATVIAADGLGTAAPAPAETPGEVTPNPPPTG
jgi:hypothetical protein